MNALTLEQLLELHVSVIIASGGSQGLRDLGRLEAVVAAQRQVVFGEELYKTPDEKAAAMIRGIIADHPFIDGNKRTGMLTGIIFLRINGRSFSAKQGEIEDFAVQIAVERLDIPVIAAWLQERSRV